jgi:PAS domain S-box-containing protein
MFEDGGSAFSLFFDNSPWGFMLAEIERGRYRHPDGFSVVRVNMEYARLLGLARVTILEKAFFDVIPGGAADWQDAVRRTASNARPVRATSYWEITDRHLDVTVFLPQRDLLAVMVADVSSKEVTTASVARHESQLDAVLRAAPELICRFLPDGSLTYANRAYCEFFDKKIDELVGHNFMDDVPLEDADFVRSRLNLLSPSNYTITYSHSIGVGTQKRWLEWTDMALFDNNGAVAEYQSIGRDITARYLADKHVRQVAGYMDDLLHYRTREHMEAEAVASESSRSSRELITDAEALQRRIDDLQKKTLTGHLDVCRMCNRVHADNGAWMVVPMFLENCTDAEVEVDLCPYCRRKVS